MPSDGPRADRPDHAKALVIADRTTDPEQVATLRRRAEQRRRQAARIRARLAAEGAAVPEGAVLP